ncbi:hypothetical protein J2R80_002786 [Bradyrhizobium sp. USDA 4541]|nr:hypothetical protein [Bradyrhizobium sp. USDA 4541]
MLKELIAKAEDEGFKLAPCIGIACPGVIKSDGSIEKAAQNLPGNWESSKFNVPASLVQAIPQIGEISFLNWHRRRSPPRFRSAKGDFLPLIGQGFNGGTSLTSRVYHRKEGSALASGNDCCDSGGRACR